MEQPEANVNVITKSRNECPVIQVAVYKDRAQVTRKCETVLKPGIQELHITDLVDLEEDSIRVEGKGKATIAEVSFQSKNVHEDEVSGEARVKELESELKALVGERENHKFPDKKAVIEKETKLLDQFFNKAARSGIAPGNEESTNVVLTEPYLKGVRDYMTEYRTLSHALIQDRQELLDKEVELDKAIEVISERLKKLRGKKDPSSQNYARECIIVLDSPEETKIQLTISYVVHSAWWNPSYDLRMFTEQGKLKLFYYGLICQSSGEDWADTKIFLSTAEPSFGGNIPRVPLTCLSFYTQPLMECALLSAPKKKRKSKMLASAGLAFGGGGTAHESSDEENDLSVLGVMVVDKTTSTSYEIARLSTIPSDNNPHKVTVAILDFEPELSYVTVPKASPNAFLEAKVVNTSPYMLLAGESSIFLDNSFVAKANLQSAAPKEEFTCSLGVDPIVRVTYKPIIKMKSSSGIFSKNETTLYEQAIEVKNLHDKTVKVLVKDSLPRSSTDKIKITLLSPEIDIKHPEKQTDVRLSKYNKLEWDLSIASMATKEIVMKYSVEHPSNKILDSSNTYVTQ